MNGASHLGEREQRDGDHADCDPTTPISADRSKIDSKERRRQEQN
jgi:hypothetical protein